MQSNNKIFINAGEQSGDMHAGALINKLKGLKSNLIISGIGGKSLQEQGVNIVHHYSKVNFIGFSSVIGNYFKIKSVFNDCVNFIRKTNPDVVILVDFPGFNLKIAKEIKRFYKGTIIYYISPQIWAWHKSRINIIKNCVDRMMVVFPFEADFYKQEGFNADFVGHPIIEKIDNFTFEKTKVQNESFIISLMPGSRMEEFKRNYPIFEKTAVKLQSDFNCKIKLIKASSLENNPFIESALKSGFEISDENLESNYENIFNSDFVLTKFGTSSLECALLGTPFCSGYKANYVNYIIAKSFVKLKYLTLVNILADKPVVKEFIQNDFTVDNLYNEVAKTLSDEKYRSRMLGEFIKVKSALGSENVIKKAENIILEYL
mgnify:CR=1 FL=1